MVVEPMILCNGLLKFYIGIPTLSHRYSDDYDLWSRELWPSLLPYTITGWIGMSRIVRGQVLKYKNQEFVLAVKNIRCK